MRRFACALAVFGILTVGTGARAQEVGARRVELGVATGGGALFIAAGNSVSRFGQYSVGATVTFNVNDRVGVEGDVGMAAGRHQAVSFGQTTLQNQRTPTIVNYDATLIDSPTGSGHHVAPYLAAGMGGLTMLNAPETEALGLTAKRTFLTVNTGAGVNWFPVAHLGLRGDYRFFVIRNPADAPAFLGQDAIRLAHRVYGAVVLTYLTELSARTGRRGSRLDRGTRRGLVRRGCPGPVRWAARRR